MQQEQGRTGARLGYVQPHAVDAGIAVLDPRDEELLGFGHGSAVTHCLRAGTGPLAPGADPRPAEFRPAADEGAEATEGAITLVDGTLWPCWSWAGERELWAGKYKTTGHGSLIITNLAGRIIFVSEPVPGNQHDMAKLKGSECEIILKLAGGVFGDKGFIGTDYITTPVRKPEDRELYMREHDYNNQVSSFRAPVERAIANLKTWRILFTDYRRPLKTFLSSLRAAIGLYFFKESFA